MKRFALLLPLLAACGGKPLTAPAEETDPPGTDEAKVIVYRDSFRNANRPYAFFDDEELLGFCQTGAWFEVRLTPGPHFLFLYGVSSAGVRATLQAGKTYFLRVDSVPELFHLQLRLTPIVPGMREFEEIDQILADLEHREAVHDRVNGYLQKESRLQEIEDQLAYLQTEGLEQCAVLKAEDGR